MFVSNSEDALHLYEKIFNAKGLSVSFEGIKVGEKNARFSIGESLFALADENKELGSKSPLTLGGTSICIQLMVADVEKIIDRAVQEGCVVEMPIITLPHGIKVGNIKDPFGYIWSISKEVN